MLSYNLSPSKLTSQFKRDHSLVDVKAASTASSANLIEFKRRP